jgi:four helix bundle protein
MLIYTFLKFIMLHFKELNVWQECRTLNQKIYQVTKQFPKEELFGLTNQMRRCTVSIASNIAEGCGRSTSKDLLHFLHIARGSLYELEAQVLLAFDQKYLNQVTLADVEKQMELCRKLLQGFINFHRNKLKTGHL